MKNWFSGCDIDVFSIQGMCWSVVCSLISSYITSVHTICVFRVKILGIKPRPLEWGRLSIELLEAVRHGVGKLFGYVALVFTSSPKQPFPALVSIMNDVLMSPFTS